MPKDHPGAALTGYQTQKGASLLGAARIKRDYDMEISEKALRRIWKQEGLLKRKRKKHRTKQDLRAVKAAWRLFEQVDLETKDLLDIPELWPQIRRLGLPKVQYAFREVVSGLHFIAYAQERSLSLATLFASLVLRRLQSCGATAAPGRWQTDNGSDFIGSWKARKDSSFTRLIESRGLEHHTIPPRAHTWQADVETVHGLIEDEFYEVEHFCSPTDFLPKAAAYCLWFNVARKNSYKNHQTPWQIIHQRDPTVSPEIVNLPPVFLDELFVDSIDKKSQGGYDLIPHP